SELFDGRDLGLGGGATHDDRERQSDRNRDGPSCLHGGTSWFHREDRTLQRRCRGPVVVPSVRDRQSRLSLAAPVGVVSVYLDQTDGKVPTVCISTILPVGTRQPARPYRQPQLGS